MAYGFVGMRHIEMPNRGVLRVERTQRDSHGGIFGNTLIVRVKCCMGVSVVEVDSVIE